MVIKLKAAKAPTVVINIWIPLSHILIILHGILYVWGLKGKFNAGGKITLQLGKLGQALSKIRVSVGQHPRGLWES